MASKKKKKSFSEQVLTGEYKSSLSRESVAPALKKTNKSMANARSVAEAGKGISSDGSLFSAFEDGYNLGDISRTIVKGTKKLGNTIADTGGKLLEAPVKTLEDFIVNPLGGKDTDQKQKQAVKLSPTAGQVNQEGYKDVGTTYGRYKYQNYAERKDYKIYEKEGKYYYYDEKRKVYTPINQAELTSKELDKQNYKEAVKLGYSGDKDTLKIEDKIKLDTSRLTEEEYKDYKKDLERQQKDEEEQQKRDNKVRIGGAGIRGALGELTYLFGNAGESIDENIIEPIRDAGSNYELGAMTERLGLEAYKKMMGEENNYDELKKEYETYTQFNQDIVSEGNHLDQTFQTMPNQIGGLWSGIKGGGVGGTLGAIGGGILGAVITKTPEGTLAGAQTGAKLLGGTGYVAGQSQYTYQLEAGLQYQTLIDMGIPEEIAKKEAQDTGRFSALVESGESLIDLISFGKLSAVKDVLFKDLAKEYGEETVKEWILKSTLKNTVSEGVEETVQEGGAIYNEKQAFEQAGMERDDSQDLERLKESLISGMLSSFVIGGGTNAVIGGTKVGINTVNDKTLKNSVTKQVDAYIEETGIELTAEEKKTLIDTTTEALKVRLESGQPTEVTSDDIKIEEHNVDALPGVESGDIAPVGENVVQQPEQDNIPIIEDNQVQQAGQQDIAPVVEQANDTDLKRKNYTYVASETDSQITRELKESATRVMNDTKRSHEFVETVSKIAERTQTKIRFTNTAELNALGYGVEGKRVNGLVTKDGEILVNIDSQKALNTIVGHETTHLLEGTKEYKLLQDAVFKYAQTKGDFARESERMGRIYAGQKNVNIDNELTSELIGDYLFTDQQFLDNLTAEQPGIVRKIYNEIKHWIKMATAGSKEARQLEDLKYRFEKALNKQNENKQVAVKETKQATTQETKDKSVVEVESNTQEKTETVQEIETEETSKVSENVEAETKIEDTPKEETTIEEEFSLSEDNKGRKLTEAQEEYFEDSVVRDENGNLLTMYHGTSSGGYTIFDPFGGRPGLFGQGSYFTADNTVAESYTEKGRGNNKQIYEVYLNITNPIDMDGQANVEEWKQYFSKHIPEATFPESGTNEALYRFTLEEFENTEYDRVEVAEIMVETFQKMGYDGITHIGGGRFNQKDNTRHRVYITFESNQIKEVTNKNPTESDDIRYSLSEKTDDEVREALLDSRNDISEQAIKKMRKQIAEQRPEFFSENTDNLGRKLSKGMKDFMEDSKARDINDSLSTVYHTTTDSGAQFNEFNPVGTDYYRFGDQVVNYYTDSKVMSGSYADQRYETADTSKITSIDEVNKFLESFDNALTQYRLKEAKDGNGYYIASFDRATTLYFENQEDLFKNVKEKFYRYNKQFGSKKGIAKHQYEGYVNITNPYEVDAEGRSWGEASKKIEQSKIDEITKIKSDKEKAYYLKRLAEDSQTRNEEYDFSGDEWTYYRYKHTAEAIKGRELNEAVQYCAMFGFEYNDYAKEHGNLPSGDSIVTDLTTELTETNYNMFKDMTLSDFVRVYAQEYEKNMLYGKEDSYFKHEYKNITGELKEITPSELYKITKTDFDSKSIESSFTERQSTNDIVKQVIEMNKNGSDYDGVIINNVVDYGGKANGDYSPANLYVTFNSNQFKAWDNENPTEDSDIRYSLSELDEDIAPTGDYNVYGSEVGLQRQVEEAIAPLQEQVQELTKVITDLQENIAPASLESANEVGDRTLQQMTDEDAPTTDEGTFRFLDEAPLEVKNKRDITYDIQNTFNIKHTEARELYNKIANMPDLTVEGVREELENYKNVKMQIEDDYYKGIQNYIKGTKLDVSEIKGQITDYDNTYRMANMGKGLTLANSGQSIDSFYQELNELYPNVFPDTVTAEADQLELISQMMFRDTNLTYTETIDDDALQILSEKLYSEIGNRMRYNSAEAHATNWWRHYKDMLAPGEEAPIKTDITQEEYLKSLPDVLDEDYAPYLEQAREVNASNTEQTSEMASIMEELNRLDTEKAQEVNEAENEPTIAKNPYEEMLSNFVDRIKGERTQTPVQRVEKSRVRNALDTGKRLFVNEMVETDNLAHETGNLNIKYKGDMLNSVAGEIEGEIYTAQTDNEGRQIGASLSDLFAESKELGMYEAFNHYLELYSNIDRHKQGKGSKVSLTESEQLIKAYDKESSLYKEWAEVVWQYGKNIRGNLVDAGLIDQAFSNRLGEMYPHYVPYVEQRDVSNYYPDLGEIKSTSVIKRAKGGASNLLPIEEALTKYTFASKKAVRQNQFYQEIVSTLEDKAMIGADVRSDATDLETSLYRDETGNYLTAYFNGQQQSVRISDDLYTGLKNDLKHQIEGLEQKFAIVTDPVQKLSEIRRNLLTSWNPMFIIRNPIMDIQDAVFNSKYTKDFVKHYNIKTFIELGKANTETARQFLTLYGSGNVMGEFSSDGTVKNAKFLKGIQRANNVMELAPRFAEFKASLDNGASIQEAMYNAREVTTNFSRGGTITKALNKNGFTFLNVSVQGFDKFIRNFSGENGAKGVASSLLKATTLGVLPALFNELAFGGDDDEKDEDYDALPDYIKDNYYLIKTGDGEFIRIPKGRVLSVFGSAGRRTLEYLQGEEDAFEGFLKNANSQIGVSNPLDSNILTPLFQAFGSENGEAWYGGDIVPSRLQDKAPEEQYDASTDKFSIWLGDKLGVSPYKINYVLDQYSGGIGDIFLPMITDEATNDAEGPGVLLAPIKDAFTSNSTFDNKYASEIYTLSDKMDKLPTATKETDEYKIQDAYLYSVTSEMASLYAERREVQADKTLTKKEKYAKVQAIQEQINSLAKEGLDNYQNVSKTDNYAIVGGREFNKYTTDSGEERWGAVFSDVLDDMNSMGMDIDEKSEYFKATSTISSIQSNYEDSSDYVSKKRDVISIIKGTNLNDEQKAYLYDKYYGNTDVVNAMVKLGVDFDSYLDYESQNFEADKDANGKSISGSKKAKVFDYINSMNIDFEQRLILVKLQYPSYDEYNPIVIEYLNNSDLTYEEEVVILKKLGFEVDANGNIRW